MLTRKSPMSVTFVGAAAAANCEAIKCAFGKKNEDVRNPP